MRDAQVPHESRMSECRCVSITDEATHGRVAVAVAVAVGVAVGGGGGGPGGWCVCLCFCDGDERWGGRGGEMTYVPERQPTPRALPGAPGRVARNPVG